MRALRYHGPRDLRLEQVAAPVAGPGELLIRVSVVGVCGTDAAEYVHGPHLYWPHDRPHPASGHHGPVIPGHELVGVVEALGPGVAAAGFAPGDLVASGAGAWCGACAACLAGRTNGCARYWTVGLQRDGGLAELVAVPAQTCVAVAPYRLTEDAAALAQPMAIAAHAVDRGSPRAGEDVLVVGAGGIGAFITWAASQAGGRVTATDPDPERRALAARLGATATAAPDEAADITADLVLEVSGTAPGLATALRSVRPGGRVVLVGLHEPPSAVDLRAIALREVSLIGTVAHRCLTDLPAALALLAARAEGWSDIAPVAIPLESVVDDGLLPMAEGRPRASRPWWTRGPPPPDPPAWSAPTWRRPPPEPGGARAHPPRRPRRLVVHRRRRTRRPPRSTAWRGSVIVGPAQGAVHTELAVGAFTPGGWLAPHVHSFEEAIYILEGELALEIDGRVHHLVAGDYGLMNVGVWHALANKGTTEVRWLSVNTPMRLGPDTGRTDTYFNTEGWDPAAFVAKAKRWKGDASHRFVGHYDGTPPQMEALALPEEVKGRKPVGMDTALLAYSGISVKMLVDKGFGADLLTLFTVDYEPARRGPGPRPPVRGDLLLPRGRVHRRAGRQDVHAARGRHHLRRRSAASTASTTTAPSGCAGWRRRRRSRRPATPTGGSRPGRRPPPSPSTDRHRRRPRRTNDGRWRGRGGGRDPGDRPGDRQAVCRQGVPGRADRA